jgi:hypothetical protein
MTAEILDVSETEYRGDPGKVPSLSASIAKVLIMESPAHAYDIHPKLGNRPRKPTAAMDEGTLVHALLLGKGTEIQIIDAPDFRTKAAQEARDMATGAGRLPVLRHKLDAAEKIVSQVRERIASFGISLDGMSEVAFKWDELGEDGEPVACRARLDHVNLETGLILDVKKTESANPKKIARYMIDYGYDIQWAAYTRAVEFLKPELQGRVEMVFLFVELDPPYVVVPAKPAGLLREFGLKRWDRAVKLWERCLRTNSWPGYVTETAMLEPPAWMVADELGI